MPQNDKSDARLEPFEVDITIEGAGKLDTFDGIIRTTEAVLAGIVTGKASSLQADAALKAIREGRDTLIAKTLHQRNLEALADQGYTVDEKGIVIQGPTLLTGTPFRRRVG